ncbi:MAG: T9SS type A sorting domain-containing protein, partial [candidate division Zixibacteria bacterium]|nr:T9SS type A sorting domain-containing protein [candidate division Zixibacteria bacterium]
MGGNVYFYTNNSDSVVISWEDVPDAGQIGYFTFQIVLIAPDTVLFQYESMENHNPLARTSIGMEDAEGLVGLEISYCEDYTDGETSVRFNLAQPPGEFDWLSVDVDNGTIIPTEFSDVTITCSAGDHPDGIYFAYIDLHSSDPYNFNIEIPVIMNIGMTSVDENSSLPNHHELTNNYPNPFNSTTAINYTVSKQSDVSLDIYNLMGQKIERLVDSSHKPGEYSVNWNAYMYSSGVYFYRFIAGSESITKQMTYLK